MTQAEKAALRALLSTLITDRSGADVERVLALYRRGMEHWTAEELAWFNGASLRGSYDHTDLNRVTQAVAGLNKALLALGYAPGYQPLEIVSGRAQWLEADYMTPARGAAYLLNARRLLEALGLYSAAPSLTGQALTDVTRLEDNGRSLPESMAYLTTEGANDIEKALLRVGEAWKGAEDALWYSGEIYTGEV